MLTVFGQTAFGQFWCFSVLVKFCCCCCCCCSWLLPVVACWCLLLPVGGACWCLLVVLVGACWCLLLALVGACWCLLVLGCCCCCLCVWWVCSRFGPLPRTSLRRTALPLGSWPTLANPTVANRVWAALFGDRVWPNRLWPALVCVLCVFCVCVFCVCLCGVGVGFTVSVWGFQGFGLVMFGAPGTALPRTALPLDRPKFRSFSPLSPQNSLFSSLSGCLLVEFWWCFEDRDPQMCTFGLSGCRVKPRRLRGRRGFTRQPENSKRERPGASNTAKIPREDPQRGKKRRILRRDREKKARNFGPPTLRAPTLRTPTLRTPTHVNSKHTKKPEQLIKKTKSSHPTKLTLANVGRIRMAKIGLAKVGFDLLLDHPKFRSFFLSPAGNFILSSLWEVFSWNFGGVLKTGTFRASGLGVEGLGFGAQGV